MRKINIMALLSFATALCSCGGNSPKVPAAQDGEYTIDIFATNDIHGRYFDSLYIGNQTKSSLLAVSEYMNGVREELGEDKVVLLDAGDFLQGDNAAYYFNYIDTETEHLYARMAKYMKYDAVVVGNHDIEAGHAVYDRMKKELSMPFLAANAVRDNNGKAYFQEYTILQKNGLKVAVIGFTNPNMKGWLSPEIWSGMTFTDLMECAQGVVDKVIAKENPQVVIVATHSGSGAGDGSSLESQGRDLLYSLKGVDFLICAHDHRPYVEQKDGMVLLNSGSHCRNLSHGKITVTMKDGAVESKSIYGDLVTIDKDKVDTTMREAFRADYEAVKAFTLQEVGRLDMPLSTRDAYIGMSDYMNLIHTIGLSCEPAQLSFAAPLTFNGYVNEGTLIYNDLFTIYPYENQLFVVRMTGRQILKYLEYSYEQWIQTVKPSDKGAHILRIAPRDDPRTGSSGWSFTERSYNFDSMAGAYYTVDITKPYGDRVDITRLADGSEFDPADTYCVAMTSYRASGGGDIMKEGAGIDTDNIDEIVEARYPEIRELIYEYLKNHLDIDGNIASVTSEELSQPAVVGEWKFVPEDLAKPLLENDINLLFPKR